MGKKRHPKSLGQVPLELPSHLLSVRPWWGVIPLFDESKIRIKNETTKEKEKKKESFFRTFLVWDTGLLDNDKRCSGHKPNLQSLSKVVHLPF